MLTAREADVRPVGDQNGPTEPMPLVRDTRLVRLLAPEDEEVAGYVADEAMIRWDAIHDGDTYRELTPELAEQLVAEAAAFFIREGHASIKWSSR